MRIKGVDRERRYRKRRYGMRVDGSSVRRVQLALIERAARPADRSRSSLELKRV